MPIRVDWQKLAAINELTEGFEADSEGFRRRIEERLAELEALPPQQRDHLALLRVLEVTNGCTQWAFRRGDAECLPVERTRECMRVVIGFIKERRIVLPGGAAVPFGPQLAAHMDQITELYHRAFKHDDDAARREFHAASAAQFLLCGRQRLLAAQELAQEQFAPLFGDHFLARGRRYIASYLEALPEPDPAATETPC